MTERKPRGMSFTSWIDQQIIDAEKRGVFDNLPGAGKPLPPSGPGETDYGQAWLRDYARREGVSADEILPTPLKLRKEIERLAEAVPDMHSEQEVRDTVADINRRIVEWRRIPVGPPVFVPLVKTEAMVSLWRQAQSTKAHAPPAPPAPPAASGAPAVPIERAKPARHRWWRRIGRPRSGA